MELINTHCHSRYCGHGEGEIEEYAAIAADAGLKTLAFTEHYPLSSDFDPIGYLSVPLDEMPAYKEAVFKAKEVHPNMDIIYGVELDYLGKDDDRNLEKISFDEFELVLGSVHFVDKWPFDDPAQRDAWLKEGAADHIWKRYVELWCDAVLDSTLPFDVMSHPDLAKKFNYYPSFPLQELYSNMVDAISSTDRMIELNTSGSYYACKDPFPTMELLTMFASAGVPCTVGTDAHEPHLVTRDIEKAYSWLYEAGYREVTVPTSTKDRRTMRIE